MSESKERVHGYEIKEAVTFTNDRGFALAENPNAPQPFVTWQFTEENGKRDYYWGHYATEEHRAKRDLSVRIADYQTQYGVAVRSVFPPMEIYNYFSTQRPVDIGTFPKTANGPLSFVNFDERLPVEDGAFRAWGILTYSAPLTEKQMDDYELRAASGNPDVLDKGITGPQRGDEKTIAAQLAEGAARVAKDIASRPIPDKNTNKSR